MRTALLFIVSIVTFLSQSAQALEFFRRVEYPIESVFIPEGFDNNDSVQLVIHGKLPNSCYQIGYTSTELDQDTNKLYVSLIAYEYVGECSEYGAPYHLTVQAGLFRKAGSYGVYDKKSGVYLGGLTIGKAKAGPGGTDELDYAPVLDGFLNETANGKELVVRGVFNWSCLEIGDIKIMPQQDVVVVLPQTKKNPDVKCVVGEFGYEVKRPVTEKLPKGEFLLHIRSMGGQSINKVVHQ